MRTVLRNATIALAAPAPRVRMTAGSGPQRSLECWAGGKRVIASHATEEEAEDIRNGAYQEVEEFVRALQSGSRPQPSIDDILP